MSWGGDPSMSSTEVGKRLSPRKSFAKWQTTVKQESRPWAAWEIAAATRLRDALTRISIRCDAESRHHIQLARDLRARDTLLAAASHELRNPISVLQLQVQLLSPAAVGGSDSTIPAATTASRLESARRQIQRLNDLVDDLLDVSRLGERPLRLRACDLREQVEECVTAFEGQGLFMVHATGDTRGVWDRTRVDQVITNLVSNAIKYGRGKPIEIRIDGTSDRLLLSVVDQGIGIAPAAREKIFELYFRAVRADVAAGLGLGLWVTQQIATRLGGTIEVESHVGSGSTFTFALPRIVQEERLP